MISDELKKGDELDLFSKLENYDAEYKKRSYKRIVFPQGRVKRVLGYLGIANLLRIHQKSHQLYISFIDNINRRHASTSLLVDRAHLETTAALAYLLYKLQMYYSNSIDLRETELMLNRMLEGYKSPTLRGDLPQSINVLTMIETADKLILASIEDDNGDKLFSKTYEYLSEGCHPNSLGLSYGSKYLSAGDFIYYSHSHNFLKGELKAQVSAMNLSCDFFFAFFDNCFNLLRHNEKLPKLVKAY